MSMFLGLVCFAISIAGILVIIRTAMRPVRKLPAYRDKVRTPQLLAAIARLDLLDRAKKKASPKRDKPNRQKDSAKYRQLLGMLNGDRDTAENLIRAYGVEKAITDLIRDRR